MSISSWLNSPFYSYNVVANKFDIESVSSNSDPCLPTQDPFLASYNTDHSAHIFNLFDSYDSETPAVPSNPLMRTFCNSSSATNSQSCNRLPGTVMAVKRNHKVIERQRRNELKMLFSRLRSLLPEKGKRTVSEQVLESLNYIRHLQQKLRELSAQREEMKIWANTLERDIVYSDILLALEEGGLEVVSAASSAINNRAYHTIHAKVFDVTSFNIHTLYQKLWNLINTHHSNNEDPGTTEAEG